MSQNTPVAFLASRLIGLEHFRHQIWEQSRREGIPIWVSEIAAAEELKGKTLDEIQVACLRNVRTIPKFVCVLDGSFGTTWNPGQVSMLELEVATAAFSGRDIWVFLLGSFGNPDSRILSLLQAIRIACPDVRIKRAATPTELCSQILSAVSHDYDGANETLGVGPFVQNIASKRTPAFNFKLNLRDIQFLDGQYVPLLKNVPDEHLVESLINEASNEQVLPERLAKLWVALRHLSSVPYNEPRYQAYLPLWEKVLSLWSSSSAWYALHGHFYMGRLAAVNTLSVIRAHMPGSMQSKLGPPTIFANNGAAASEYYSMAKLVPSWRFKHFLLRKALWNCNVAMQDSTPDPSGLLDIRAHVKLAMLRPFGAIADFKQALAIRQRAAEDLGRIGESQVHLGRAYAACHLNGRAERLLEEGVKNLEASDRYPFIVQGLRHLGTFYAKVGRRTEGIDLLLKARAIASQYEMQGQLLHVNAALKKLEG